ncbi:hypothetical protein FKW77_007402 [Venturia effusa]|uniref:Uncharacterized protein n=1 Tax=Venturia effusa TaxID=50376 RepID=A0A517LB60_9PEZI|nr:hypothetical protein FKW77_007402 [Venturia effusa]
MADSEFLLRARLKEVERELAVVKIECQRLNKVEDELKVIRSDFTHIKIEHANIKANREDVKDQVDSVDRYLNECLNIVDTTAKKLQHVEDSVSDLREKHSERTTTAATGTGALDGAFTYAEFLGLEAAILKRMDDIQGEVLKKADETNSEVLRRMDTIEAVLQLKLDRVMSERGTQTALASEAQDNKFGHSPVLEHGQQTIVAAMMEGIARKMEDVLEHSMAVVSYETKLENLEKMISHSTGIEAVTKIGSRLDAKLEELEQQIADLDGRNVQESIDADQKFRTITRQGDIHGFDNLIKLVSKLGTTMEASNKTLRDASISNTSTQNILQWVQTINNKLVDMNGRIEGLSGQDKGAGLMQKVMAGLATKSDLQYLAATLQNGRSGRGARKDKPKSLTMPIAGPSKPKAPIRPPVPAAPDRPKPKLATTLGLSLIDKPSVVGPVSSSSVQIQGKSPPMEMTPQEMFDIHSAETVDQRADHLAAFKKRVAEQEAAKAKAKANAEEKIQRIKAEAKARAEFESSEANVSDVDSEDDALLVRFAEMKKSMQSSTPIAPVMKENTPSWLASRVTSTPISLMDETNLYGDLSSASMAPEISPTLMSSSHASSWNARATDFEMPGSFSSGSQSPFDNWEDQPELAVAREERAKSSLRFADSY